MKHIKAYHIINICVLLIFYLYYYYYYYFKSIERSYFLGVVGVSTFTVFLVILRGRSYIAKRLCFILFAVDGMP